MIFRYQASTNHLSPRIRIQTAHDIGVLVFFVITFQQPFYGTVAIGTCARVGKSTRHVKKHNISVIIDMTGDELVGIRQIIIVRVGKQHPLAIGMTQSNIPCVTSTTAATTIETEVIAAAQRLYCPKFVSSTLVVDNNHLGRMFPRNALKQTFKQS